MSAKDTSATAPRWRLQFGLRTLFVLLTFASIGAAIWGVRWYRQYRLEEAIDALQAAGGQLIRNEQGEVWRVYLSGENIDDEQLGQLAGHLIFLTELTELDLVSTKVTDKGLAALHSLTQLQELYVYESPVTEKGLAALRSRMPHLVAKMEMPDPIASGLAMRNIYRHAVVAVRFHPDGGRIALGSGDGAVRLWRIHAERPVVVQAHDDWTFATEFDRNGRLLATGGGDGKIKLWPTDSLRDAILLGAHDDDVHALGFSPDGSRLYSASDDMTVGVWDVARRRRIASLTGHEDTIPTLAVSPDGRLIASGSRDDTIRLWDAAQNRLAAVLRGHQDDVLSVAFSPNGKHLASASYDGTVHIWDLGAGAPLAKLAGHADWVFAVAYHPDGSLLASVGGDGRVRVWDAVSFESKSVFDQQQTLSSLSFSPDGKLLAAASAEGDVVLWSIADGAIYRRLHTIYDGRQSLPEFEQSAMAAPRGYPVKTSL